MFAEELQIFNGTDTLWQAARPLVEAAWRLAQQDERAVWHGWQKCAVQAFLNTLPSPCSLVVGVWETQPATGMQAAQDKLVLGLVGEVVQGIVRTLWTFEALTSTGLKPVEQLEIGMEDALEIMHYARRQVAPVAWALFIDKAAWDEWLFATADDDGALDKGALLAALAEKGRCVLMGSQAREQT